MTVPVPIVPLYATQPYGVRALPFDPRHSAAALYAEPRVRPRVRAGRQPVCVARSGDARPLDRRIRRRSAGSEELAGRRARRLSGSARCVGRSRRAALSTARRRRRTATSEWRAPPAADFALPAERYAVLHVGASSPLKQWSPQRWAELAGLACGARHRTGMVGGRGRRRDRRRDRCAPALRVVRRAPRPRAVVASAGRGGAARSARHRRCAPRAHRRVRRPSRCSAPVRRCCAAPATSGATRATGP